MIETIKFAILKPDPVPEPGLNIVREAWVCRGCGEGWECYSLAKGYKDAPRRCTSSSDPNYTGCEWVKL